MNPEDDQAAAVTDNGADVGKRVFALPVDGIPGKAFETDIPVYSITMNDYRAHTGVDISASVGTKDSRVVERAYRENLERPDDGQERHD